MNLVQLFLKPKIYTIDKSKYRFARIKDKEYFIANGLETDSCWFKDYMGAIIIVYKEKESMGFYNFPNHLFKETLMMTDGDPIIIDENMVNVGSAGNKFADILDIDCIDIEPVNYNDYLDVESVKISDITSFMSSRF